MPAKKACEKKEAKAKEKKCCKKWYPSRNRMRDAGSAYEAVRRPVVSGVSMETPSPAGMTGGRALVRKEQ